MRHPMGGSRAKSAVQHRLAFLDSLRGLAALYVVLYHLTVIPDPDLKLPRWASSWVLYGGSGRIIPGALPVEDFTNALNEFISEAGATTN